MEEIRVLHVDDDPQYPELVKASLESANGDMEVLTANSPQEANALLDEEAVDCIVSDYQMPETDGLEFLKEVRECDPDFPFILFTGKGSESIASKAISAGVTDYLEKSGGSETYTLLANRVRNAVDQYRKEQELENARKRFQILVEESTDAIFVLDDEGVLQYASPVAERIFGRSMEELVGTNGFDYIHSDDADTVQETFLTLRDSPGERESVNFRLLQPNGNTILVEARGRNLLDNSLIEGIVVYIREQPITAEGSTEDSVAHQQSG